MSSTRTRLSVALAGAAALGLAVASAATLGGLTSTSLGANDTVVSSCDDNGVTIAYTNSYDAASGRYRTTGVTIGGMATACSGQNLSVTLRDSTGAAIATGTATVSGTSQAVPVTPAAAEAVAGAAVVITG